MGGNIVTTGSHRGPSRTPPLQPYLDFYQLNRISPVHQDISNLHQHFDRRAALYRHLGLPPGLVSGLSVIEFGPGSGHNALFTTALNPRRYVLVDGNPTGLKETQALIHQYFSAATCHQFVESLFEDFATDELFDCVFCEGVIPAQHDPAAFARMIARFAKPGGLVIVTCVDSVSFLSEMIRRLMRDVLISPDSDLETQLKTLRPLFSTHYESLRGRSRPLDDWLLDVIIHPIWGAMFSVADAINALDDGFDYYGVSPHFIGDWRWYKEIHGAQKRHNEEAIATYHAQVVNFVDYRVVLPAQPPAVSTKIIEHCDEIFSAMKDIENNRDATRLPIAIECIEKVASALAPISKITAESLAEAARFLHSKNSNKIANLETFRSMFGRGQSYLSFIRR
jgi:SAM-dependent methyltransferase